MYSLYKNFQENSKSDKISLKQQSDVKVIKVRRDECIFEKIMSITGQQTQKVYIKQGFLGRGGFANCYITRQVDSNLLMATKIIAKSNLSSNRSKLRLMNEIKIHKAFRHENIVEFIHYFQDSQNVYIMLELCENQSLNQLLRQRGSFITAQVQSFILGICNGVKYLHSKKYIHRDLKLGNIFLNEDFQIKIGDFGLTSQLEFLKENKRTVCGTPNYIAPEVLEGTGYHFQIDIWSIGIILYSLYYGFPPFESDVTPEIYTKIRNCQYSFPKNYHIPPQAVNLISQILVTDPIKRPSIDQILSSPFMKLGKGILLQLPSVCFERPPTKKQLQQMPHFIIPQTPKNLSNQKKQIAQKSTQDCTAYKSTYQCQQKTSCIFNNQREKSNAIKISNKQNDNSQHLPDIFVQQFEKIDENSFYFCMNTLVLGIYTKNSEIVFKDLLSFEKNYAKIFQMKLFNNLFTEKVEINYSQYRYKAVLNLKAKQLLVKYKLNNNEKQSNIQFKTIKSKNKHHQRCASNPNFNKTTSKNNMGKREQMNVSNIKLSAFSPQQSLFLKQGQSLEVSHQQNVNFAPLAQKTDNCTPVVYNTSSKDNLCFIAKVSQHREVLMLRLSNKNIQIIFEDSFEGFIIENKSGKIFYFAQLQNIAIDQFSSKIKDNAFHQLEYEILKEVIQQWNKKNSKSQQQSKTPNVLLSIPMKFANNCQTGTMKTTHKRIKSMLTQQQISLESKKKSKKKEIKISMIKIKYIISLIDEIRTKKKTKHTKNRYSQ